MRHLIEEQNREYEEALKEDQEREAREREEEEEKEMRRRRREEEEDKEEAVVLSPNALRRVRMEYFSRTEKRKGKERRRRSKGIDVGNILPTRLRSGSFHGRR